MNAAGVVAAGTLRRVTNVTIDGSFGILRIATMRTIPRLTSPALPKNCKCLGAATRSPHRDRLALQHLLNAAPVFAFHLAPVFEAAGKENSSWFSPGKESRSKVTDPDEVGACVSVLSSAYLCAPQRSCCTAFFAE